MRATTAGVGLDVVTSETGQNAERMGERVGIGRTAEVFAWGADRVVKLLLPGFPDEIGEAEAAAAALVGANLEPAPRFFGSTRIDGRYGLIYQRLDGPSMLDRVSSRPWLMRRYARDFGLLHARMHERDGAGLPDAKGRLGRAIERAGGLLPAAAMEAALQRLAIMPDGTAVCHGDMHPGNVIITRAGLAVIDWQTTVSGPAAADVARSLFLIRDSAIPVEIGRPQRDLIQWLRRRFAVRYLRQYMRRRPIDKHEVELWRLPILVARLSEGISIEKPNLLTLIGQELAATR